MARTKYVFLDADEHSESELELFANLKGNIHIGIVDQSADHAYNFQFISLDLETAESLLVELKRQIKIIKKAKNEQL